MSQPYLITKLDFPEYVPLSVNVADALINPYIRDAYTFDVVGMLTPAEWERLHAALAPAVAPVEGQEAIDYTAERTLWVALKPVWVLDAFRRFFLWHGTHITPNGVETIAEQDHQPVSSARRAELKADIEAKASHYRRLLESALRAYRPTAPSSTCGASARRRPSAGGLRTYAV